MKLDRREWMWSSWLASASASSCSLSELFAQEPSPKITNRFLEGDYAPVHHELTIAELKIEGSLPKDLEGMFVRNGPNPQFAPIGKYHWFDGDGMLHGVRLEAGKASYRNRFIRTAGFQAESKKGSAIWGGLLDPADYRGVLQGKPPYKNAANTALVWHHGKLLALWEGGEPYEIAIPELKTVGPYWFNGKLRHAFTAHPKIDAKTGEMMFFGYSPFKPHLHYSVADATGKIVRTVPIEMPRCVMMHDFAVTERYSIFMDLPETFEMDFTGKKGMQLRFRPELGARFGLIPRHGSAGDIRWFSADSCFVFHTLGAYETGDEVFLTACRMKVFPPELEGGDSKASTNGLATYPVPYQWRFNLKTGSTRESALGEWPAEFPRQREDLMGQEARFGYFMKIEPNGLAKLDRKTGDAKFIRHGMGRVGGEAVFVPRSSQSAEDDGWLLTYVQDHSRGQGELAIFDACTMDPRPTARVLIPARIPLGFHATWIDGKQIPKAS